MMDMMSIGVEDWALPCSWPPVGDQWRGSVDQFLEPFELLGYESGEAECQLFHDGVTVQNHSFYSSWSDSSSYLEETDEQKDVLATGYVVSTGEHAGGGMGLKLLERRPSPWEELPSSPETFRVISNHEMRDENTPVQQLSHLSDTESSQSVVASSSADTSDMESSDSEMVPECELSTEDMLLDDVIMDLLSCADTGLYLPPVSADDVDSLLLSPSVVSVAPPAAAYASLKSEPAPITASSLPVYREQVSVESPLTFEMEISLPAATYLPVYEEQVQVPSPASSQSSICTQSSDRKQRKKEQNKTAAQKYRHKKRGEQGLFVTEYQQLERRNIELHTRVEEMTREVDYLKGLIEEICA